MTRLTTNVLGVFALKNDRIIKKILFPEDPEEVSKKLGETTKTTCGEEVKLIKELERTGVKRIYVDNPPRFQSKIADIEFIRDETPIDPLYIADELGLDRKHVIELIKKVSVKSTESKLREVERDQILIQAVSSLDDIDEAVNRLAERLREWYSIHHPELDHIVLEHETYARLVHEVGDRGWHGKKKLGYDPDFVKKIGESAANSLGVEFTEKDVNAVQVFAKPILDIYAAKKEIEGYIDGLMGELAPNIRELAGSLLGARLIAHAGSLKRLALMPSSTIQIMGAEDAFFRFLKTGKKPPKHGIIFQYPEIRGAPKKNRGKLARTFASKLAIAAKVDSFSGKFMGDKLKKDFTKRVNSLGK